MINSVICIKENDEIKFIRCDSDGYGTGWILNMDKYKDSKNINRLMKIGDISNLEFNINETIDRAYGYGSNRPITCFENISIESIIQNLRLKYDAENVYIFDNQWYFYDGNKIEVLSKLVERSNFEE